MANVQSRSEPFSTVFKTQLLGAQVSWKIDGTKLYKDGSVVADLASVRSGHWHQSQHKGIQMRALKLKSDQGTISIAVNGASGQENYRSFYTLALTALARTSVHSPNAQINMGGGLGNMIFIFGLGMMLVAMGVAGMVAGFVIGIGESSDAIGALGIPFVALGSWLAFAMRPWNHGRLSVSPERALAAIMAK